MQNVLSAHEVRWATKERRYLRKQTEQPMRGRVDFSRGAITITPRL